MGHHTETKAPFQLDLTKSAAAFRLALNKANVHPDIKAEVVVVMDVSGSFEHEHEEGTTSILLKRFVPLANEIDPDGQIDLLTFSGGLNSVQYVGTYDIRTADTFMEDKVIDKVKGWNGGTTYSYPLAAALQRLGWLPCDDDHGHSHQPKPQGAFSRFLSRLAGNAPEPTPAAVPVAPHMHQKKRSIILFVSDGENESSDMQRTIDLLQASQDRGDEVYFLMIGACEHAKFEFVRKIAAKFKNVGVVMATDPEEFVELPDEDLVAELLGTELCDWLSKSAA